MPGERVNQYERAFRAWSLLTAAAANRSKITYAELADHLDIHPRPIRYVLAVIQDWCLREKKPPLTILVVSQSRGQPGQGFIAWDVNDLDEGYAQVYSFRWSDLANPFAFAAQGVTPEELAHRLVIRPDAAIDVYQQVRNRGFAQVVFRLALLAAYRRRCTFCGLSLTDALQVAPADQAPPAVQEAVNLVVVRQVLVPLHPEELRIEPVAGDRQVVQPERLRQGPRHRQHHRRLSGRQEGLVFAGASLAHLRHQVGVVEKRPLMHRPLPT